MCCNIVNKIGNNDELSSDETNELELFLFLNFVILWSCWNFKLNLNVATMNVTNRPVKDTSGSNTIKVGGH